MKLKHAFVFLSAILLSINAFAQKKVIRPPQAGDQMIGLNINPVFSFIGNSFNASENNSLSLPSSGVVYRKFKDDRVAARYRASFNLSQNSFIFQDAEQINSFGFIGLGFGREYRKQVSRWSIYAGAEFVFEHSSSFVRLEYDEPITVSQPFIGATRTTRNQSHSSLVGAGLFAGAEYFFSDVFFVGVELYAALLFGVTYGRQQDFEEVGTNMQGELITRVRDTSRDARLLVNMSNAQPVVIRAGVRF